MSLKTAQTMYRGLTIICWELVGAPEILSEMSSEYINVAQSPCFAGEKTGLEKR